MSVLARLYLSTIGDLYYFQLPVSVVLSRFQANVVAVQAAERVGAAIAPTASTSVYPARLPTLPHQQPFVLHACQTNGINFRLCCTLAELVLLATIARRPFTL